MRNKKYLLALILSLFSFGLCLGQGKEIVEVHPGTELLHIVNYLAKVYHPPVSKSTYIKDIHQWFGKHKTHKAVLFASHLKFNDFVDLGWCLEFPSLELRKPTDLGYFDQFHSRDTLLTYIDLCRQFAADTDYWQFYQKHKPDYDRWTNEFKQALLRDKPLEKLQDFYQQSLTKTFYFSISPIGVVLRANVQAEKINPTYGHLAPIIIPFDGRYLDKQAAPSDSTRPSFAYTPSTMSNNVWHEASHIYWEELNKPYRKLISQLSYSDSLSKQFTPFGDSKLNFYFYLHEVIADGVAIYLKKIYLGKEAYLSHLQINENAGGMLYSALVKLFEDKYWKTRKDRNFQNFIPDILSMIKQKENSNKSQQH